MKLSIVVGDNGRLKATLTGVRFTIDVEVPVSNLEHVRRKGVVSMSD